MRPKPFVAETLRNTLTEEGMLEHTLAKGLGLTKSGLSRKMNGNRPWTLEEINKACQILHRKPEFLFPELYQR